MERSKKFTKPTPNNMTQTAEEILKTTLKVTAIIMLTMILSWFAIWQGLEFVEYDWVFSKNNSVKAFQYLIYFLWGLFFSTSPMFILLPVMIFTKKLFNKK
jgi:hypothetical protein